MPSITKTYKKNVIETFSAYKRLAERALEQIDDKQFFASIDQESNSIAIVVKHIAGNQKSRFTEFLTTDGEKEDRDRDSEFIVKEESRSDLMGMWEGGWNTLLTSLRSLEAEEFSSIVEIRGEPHTVVEAINRQLTHYAYHIGQIVFLAKHFCSSEFESLSVPRNSSAEFNEFLKKKKAEGKAALHPLKGTEEFSGR